MSVEHRLSHLSIAALLACGLSGCAFADEGDRDSAEKRDEPAVLFARDEDRPDDRDG